MSGPSQVFTDYAQLASRISQHLATHPTDSQARDDLKYILGKMRDAGSAANTQDQTDATGQPIASPGAAIASGIAQGALDIPRGIGQLVLHPLKTLGQATGISNVPDFFRTIKDPNSGIAEDLDALVRATPFNLGYAPERALMDATGATSDTPASLADQARAATNVASLGLLGVKPGAIARLASRPLASAARAAVGPILDRILPAPIADVATDAPKGLLAQGMRESVVRANLAKQGYPPKIIDAMIARLQQTPGLAGTTQDAADAAARAMPGPSSVPDPLDQPTYQRRGLLTPSGPAPLDPATLVGGDASPPPQPGALPETMARVQRGLTKAQYAYRQTVVQAAQLGISTEQLRLLLRVPEAQFQAARSLIPGPLVDQIAQLRAQKVALP